MMMPKPSLFAEEERGNRRSKLGDPLVGLSKHVDFAALADEIDTALPRPSRAKGGRPPYATVLMTKILILQQLRCTVNSGHVRFKQPALLIPWVAWLHGLAASFLEWATRFWG